MPVEEIDESRAKGLVEWLREFLDESWIERELSRRGRLLAAIPLLNPNRVHPNLLIDLFAAHSTERASFNRLVWMASDIQHVVERRPEIRRQFERLLKKASHSEGYLYQASIAAHYVRAGYCLENFSIGGQHEGDIVVSTCGVSVELQCKALKFGAGRRISFDAFNRFSG